MWSLSTMFITTQMTITKTRDITKYLQLPGEINQTSTHQRGNPLIIKLIIWSLVGDFLAWLRWVYHMSHEVPLKGNAEGIKHFFMMAMYESQFVHAPTPTLEWPCIKSGLIGGRINPHLHSSNSCSNTAPSRITTYLSFGQHWCQKEKRPTAETTLLRHVSNFMWWSKIIKIQSGLYLMTVLHFS